MTAFLQEFYTARMLYFRALIVPFREQLALMVFLSIILHLEQANITSNPVHCFVSAWFSILGMLFTTTIRPRAPLWYQRSFFLLSFCSHFCLHSSFIPYLDRFFYTSDYAKDAFLENVLSIAYPMQCVISISFH